MNAALSKYMRIAHQTNSPYEQVSSSVWVIHHFRKQRNRADLLEDELLELGIPFEPIDWDRFFEALIMDLHSLSAPYR